jgi:hypothetical protein
MGKEEGRRMEDRQGIPTTNYVIQKMLNFE